MTLLVYSLFFILFSSNVFLGCHCLDPEKLKLIDDVITESFIPANNVTGMSLSVVHNGETIISKGYGKQDIEKGLNVSHDTLFSIGSITKSFIATLVVKTMSEKYPTFGESVLDIPIYFFNPNFNFTFSDRFRSEQVSFRDLLSHRTCLFDDGIQLLLGTMRTNKEYNYRTRYESQICGHRGGFIYNNAMYALVGEIVASFEGQTLEELVRSFMLELGMQNSTTIDTSASYEDLPNMSQGYYMKDDQILKFNMKLLRRIEIGLGAGGILSTSNDMAKYINFHLNKGKVGNKQVVTEEALSWMYKPSIHIASLEGKQSEDESVMGMYAYGLGLVLGLYDGYAMLVHDGYWPPYQSLFNLYPAKNLGIFMTTNGPGVLPDTVYTQSFVAEAIFDIITGVYQTKPQNIKRTFSFPVYDMENPIQKLKNIHQKNFSINKIIKLKFEDVVGHYGNKTVGDITISLDSQNNTFLQVNMSEWSIGRLVPVDGSETKFLISWTTDILHHFYTYPGQPIPVLFIDFHVNSLHLLADDETICVFVKNATLDTFPVFPWDPTSCGRSL